jgi:hypothetical protein
MTNSCAIGLAIVYEAKNGNQMLFRVSELFSEHSRTLELWLEQNGGFSHVVEPSQAKTPYGVFPQAPRFTRLEDRIALVKAAQILARSAHA